MATDDVKAQPVRLLDVFVFGPLMVYAGTKVRRRWLKWSMIGLGAGTSLYNLRNYQTVARRQRQGR